MDLKISDDIVIERCRQRLKQAWSQLKEIRDKDLNRAQEFSSAWAAKQEILKALGYSHKLLRRKRRAAKSKK